MDVESRDLEDRVTLESLSSALTIIRRDELINSVIPLIMIAVMWQHVDPLTLSIWAILFFSGMGVRYGIATSFFRQDIHYKDIHKWGLRLAGVTLYIALLWASTPFLFYVDRSVEYQVFLFVLLITFSVGSIVAGLYWFPLCYLRAWPILISLAIRLALEGTIPYLVLSGLLLFMLSGLTVIAKRLNRTMRTEIRQRYESALLNEALHSKTEEAEQATLAKTRFLAAASHDLRQPVHAISLFVGVLKNRITTTKERQIIDQLGNSVDALNGLCRELLDISRLDANVIQPNLKPVSLKAVFSRLSNEYAPQAAEKGLEWKMLATDERVISDPVLLENILRNLITNAVRYTQEGYIELGCENKNGLLSLYVKDTGPGIEVDMQKEVFREFVQLHNPERNSGKGLGLGLAIVQRLTTLLGIRLELVSGPGAGSVFRIELPASDAPVMEPGEMKSSPDHLNIISARQVLIIDDEPEILAAMKIMLEDWGANVLEASSEEQARELLEQTGLCPELIIADYRLRDGKTGTQAIRKIQEIYGSSIPALIITGDTGPERLKEVQESGCMLLHKPVKPAKLRSTIMHLISKDVCQSSTF